MKKLALVTLFVLLVAFLPFLLLRGNLWFASDFLHQEIPFILETKRMLATGAPWWSWNTYLGADFIGSYAFYTLTSPFVWINCLFPEEWVAYSTALTLVLKFLCMGWVTLIYQRKMGVSHDNSWFGALIFSFSSFSICSLYYYHFYEPIIAFVLMLIAVERLMRGEKWGATCVALAAFAMVFVNFYFAIGSLIATLIYVIFRAFSSEIVFNWRMMVRGVVAIIVGIMMCSLLLLPVFDQMLLTTRAGTQSAFDSTAILNLLERLRTLFMPKIVEGTTAFVNPGSGSFSNEACIAVFGLALCCIYIVSKRDWLAWLAVTLLVLYLTPLNGIFTLFTNPLYTRWAYFLALVIVLCTVRVLDEGCNVKRGVVTYSVVASLVVLAFVAKVIISIGGISIGVRTMIQIALFFVGIVVLLLWSHGKMSLHWLKVTTVIAIVVQMWLFLANLGFDTAYNNLTCNVEKGDAIVSSRTDFRGTKDFLVYNAGLLRNRATVHGYHSVITNDMHDFYSIATRDFWSTNKLRANIHQDEFDALLSVKDIYEFDSVGNLTRRDNKYYIPMGFAYDSYITRRKFDKLINDTTINLPLLMLNSVVVEDRNILELGFIHEFELGDTLLDFDSVVNERKRVVVSEFTGDSQGYKAQVDVSKKTLMFFSVPIAYGFKATIDGKPTTIFKSNLCMQAMVIPAGNHSIVVAYHPPFMKLGCGLSLLGLMLLLFLYWSDKKKSRTTSRRP